MDQMKPRSRAALFQFGLCFSLIYSTLYSLVDVYCHSRGVTIKSGRYASTYAIILFYLHSSRRASLSNMVCMDNNNNNFTFLVSET